MSVFSDLCMRARRLGATRLIFTAELYDHENPEGVVGHWSVVAGTRSDEDAIGQAEGVSGEHALRNLVDALEGAKKGRGKP
jgi:hypothetical protein